MGRPKKNAPQLNSEQVKQTAETTNIIDSVESTGQTKNKFFIPRDFSRSGVHPLYGSTSKGVASRKYTSEQISNLLLNPYVSYKELQGVSNYLLYNSSMYNNFLNYLANIMTFDYILECEDTDKVNKTTIENRYYDSAKIVHKINVKTVFPAMLKRVLANGECYFYNMIDNSNSIIVEVDSSICQLAQIDDNNIWRYYVNLNLITDITVLELPEEIQLAYKTWSEGGKGKKKTVIDGMEIPEYLYLVSNKGFAIFSHIRKTQHDFPYMSEMFEDLNDLESDKTYMNQYIKENNIKLIHQLIPVGEDGAPLMEEGVIRAYHNSTKEHLPSNVAPLTNPFKVESISLDKSQSTAINLVEHSTKVIMQDSGISENVFNASSTLGLQYSTLADAYKMYPYLYFFENFLNLQIKSLKCKVRFLKINYFNQLDWHERYYADVQAGGSRSLFVCTSGIEPYDMINLSKTEDILGIDEMLKPKLNSSQMNSEDLNGVNSNGRPKTKEKDKADSTARGDEFK